MRLLLVEDHPELSRWIAKAFRDRGMAVDVMVEGTDADHVLATQDYALVILDLTLPGMDGLEVLKRLRGRGQKVPVLVLTARSEVGERVRGLDLGADDYLTKPFVLEELEARVKALLRRGSVEPPRVVCGGLAFDAAARSFEVKGARLELTPREVAVLEVLISRQGRAVPREHLFSQVFELEQDVNPEALQIYVHRVRRKLEAAGAGATIRTLRGLGYLLQPT
jgi:two-component system response regulator TctD